MNMKIEYEFSLEESATYFTKTFNRNLYSDY